MPNPPSKYNQPVADPVAHFKAIPWCAELLADKSIVAVNVPDRTPIPSTESALVRETLNTPETVNACLTFLRYIKPTKESRENGDSKEKPFLEMVALLDLQSGVNGYAKTAHGGFYGVTLDEVMGTASNMQSGKLFDFLSSPMVSRLPPHVEALSTNPFENFGIGSRVYA
jgi:hypothetical protein